MFLFSLVCNYFVSFLVCNHLEEEERELVALLFCPTGVLSLLMFYDSSSHCHGLVCSV